VLVAVRVGLASTHLSSSSSFRRPHQCSACIAPVPSHTLHLLLPDRLHDGQPLPLQASHFMVPLPLHVGQSFILSSRPDRAGGRDGGGVDAAQQMEVE
jgi:hypothetical protein